MLEGAVHAATDLLLREVQSQERSRYDKPPTVQSALRHSSRPVSIFSETSQTHTRDSCGKLLCKATQREQLIHCITFCVEISEKFGKLMSDDASNSTKFLN